MNAVPSSSPPSGGGEPPADQSLDRRLTVLETRFDTILPTLATKAEFVTVLLGSNFAMFNAMKALMESSRPSSPAIERRVAPESLPALPQR